MVSKHGLSQLQRCGEAASGKPRHPGSAGGPGSPWVGPTWLVPHFGGSRYKTSRAVNHILLPPGVLETKCCSLTELFLPPGRSRDAAPRRDGAGFVTWTQPCDTYLAGEASSPQRAESHHPLKQSQNIPTVISFPPHLTTGLQLLGHGEEGKQVLTIKNYSVGKQN